jgi:hypothetical protein
MLRTLHTILLLGVLALTAAPPDGRAATSAEPRRVTILPSPPRGVLVATVGTPLELSAQLELDDGKRLPLGRHVTWQSSDPRVLRVDGAADRAGSLIPLRPGTVAVTITYPPISGRPVPYGTSRPLGDAVTVVVREP